MVAGDGWAPVRGSRLHLVYRAVLAGRGRAMTVHEIAAAVAFADGGPAQVAPLVYWLVRRGWLARVPGPWWAWRYVPKRCEGWYRLD